MAWAMFGFFVFVTFLFMVIAVFFPEVVGITGKKALEIQKEQQGDAISTSEITPKPSSETKPPQG